MRKTFIILASTLIFFLLEFVLFNIFGAWFKPNLLLLLVIFYNLIFGIRYSLLTAVLAGLLSDSFGAGIVGAHALSFIICAYVTTVTKQYVFHMGSAFPRLILVAMIAVCNVFVLSMIYWLVLKISPWVSWQITFFQEVLPTVIAASFVLERLKICVSRLFV